VRLLRRRKQRTTCLAFSPDGRRLAVGGRVGGPQEGRVDVWEVPAGDKPITLPALPSRPEKMAFTAEGGLAVELPGEVRLYSGAQFRTTAAVRQWDREDHTPASFSRDGRWVLLDAKSVVRLIDLRPPFAELWHCPPPEGRGVPGRAGFSPDGRRLAVKAEHTVEVWDAATGARVALFENSGDVWVGYKLVWSPDGHWVCEMWQQWLTVWDAAAGRPVFRRPAAFGEWIADVAFHAPSGRLGVAIAGRKDGTVRLYAPGSWREEAAYAWPTGQVCCLAFSPGGALAAAGGGAPEVVLWDVDL
jgi:WD40 repeat protein